jgi:hypothetical protein
MYSGERPKELSEKYRRFDEQRFKLHEELDAQDLAFEKQLKSDDLTFQKEWGNVDIDNWKKINAAYFNLIDKAQKAFNTLLTINKILVVIGISLLFNSVVYTWINNIDFFGIITGAAGGTFIALFFILPQKRINIAIGNLAQIQMVFKTHAAKWEFLKLYGKGQLGIPGGLTIDEAKQILELYKDLEIMTEKSVKIIQDYIENEPNSTQGTNEKDTSRAPAS